EIRRQVFCWKSDLQKGKVESVGALVSRIRNGWACPEPDPEVDRDLWNRYRTPHEKQADAEAQRELDGMLHRRRPEPKPPVPNPDFDNPWGIAVSELSAQFPDGVLARATAQVVGEHGEAEIWQITLDSADAQWFGWLNTRGAILIRRTLASIQGRAVLVDVI